MGERLRFIQVGTGGFGGYWCREVLPRLVRMGRIEPAAAVDINPEALRNAQEGYGIPPERCFTDARRAFEEVEADFAIVVVPPAHHEAIVDLAVARGLHILSEKPIADTMAACVRIYRKVRAAGIKMAVTMSHRFDQDKQSLERLIKSGEFGACHYIVGRNTWNCRKFPSWGAFRYRIPDALLVEGTVHHFDIMRSLAGSNAKTVYCRSWNAPWGDFAGDSSALVIIEMENGIKVFYEGSKTNATTLNSWMQDYWRAECEKATLELDNRRLRVLSDLGGERAITEKRLAQQPAWMNPWLAEMFVDWLGGGPEPPNSLDDNIECAALLFAAIESAHTNKVIDVQEYLRAQLGEEREKS
ncbi:MAG: Gfo/Idh/MocA family oxidoreductase [Planctomycetes bacterium]|nr:Gfo/Idh/MocA family oxidoreductase [Planctomycetota bacterium]